MDKPLRTRRTAAAGLPGRSHAAGGASAQTKARSNAVLVHELQVHQVELEMQNEELRRAQIDLAAARDRFIDLYDLAPVGYVTLDRDGVVVGANLTSAAMFGEDRQALLGRRFAHFVAPADADRYHRHLLLATKSGASQRVELSLRRRSGACFHAQLDCLPVAPPGAPATLRVTLTDNTQRREAEMDRRIANSAVESGEASRRFIARELHEELGQRLSVLKMELAGLRAATSDPPREERIASMLETLDEAVAMVRRIATELRPLMLDDLGLNAAIDWLAHDSSRRLGLEVNLRLAEIDPPLDERTAVAMYRFVQEALAYVARRGHATQVAIDIRQAAAQLVMTVQGSGAVPTTQGAPSSDAGDNAETTALRDRAHLLGGQLGLDHVRGRGPRITLHLPLPTAAHQPGSRMPRENE